jgi:hypothetical protein
VSGVSGIGAYTRLYTGQPLAAWVDAGDMLPAPLLATTGYVYQLADSNGTVTTPALYPVSSLQTADSSQTQLLIRLIQAGVNNLTLPAGINTVQVTTQMPLGGWQALPFIIVNLDLLQQQDTMIGEDVVNPNAQNIWTIPTWAKYLWRISILSRSAAERDYYRDQIVAICRVLKATVFPQIGSNMRHDVQASSGVDVDEWTGKQPGFYYADIMFGVEGALEALVITNYGTIAAFNNGITVSGSDNGPTVTDTVHVPPY